MSDTALPYHEIPDPPAAPGAAAVMVRLVDGLAFRYRWATEGLRPEDVAFRPGPGSMTLLELLAHLCRLASWVDNHLGGAASAPFAADADGLRRQTLAHLHSARTRLLGMSNTQLAACRIEHSAGPMPFWNMINGPLADALTHVGQVNSWRRLSGNPSPKADVFRGRAPRDA